MHALGRVRRAYASDGKGGIFRDDDIVGLFILKLVRGLRMPAYAQRLIAIHESAIDCDDRPKCIQPTSSGSQPFQLGILIQKHPCERTDFWSP